MFRVGSENGNNDLIQKDELYLNFSESLLIDEKVYNLHICMIEYDVSQDLTIKAKGGFSYFQLVSAWILPDLLQTLQLLK